MIGQLPQDSLEIRSSGAFRHWKKEWPAMMDDL
jgi:hypothetical protein